MCVLPRRRRGRAILDDTGSHHHHSVAFRPVGQYWHDSAQESGTEAQLPEGVAVEVLGRQEISPVPATPAYLGLARLTYEPGAATVVQLAEGPTILHVEAGSLALQTGEAAQATPIADGSTINTGEEVLLPAGTTYITRNDGGIPARVIRAVVNPSATVPVTAPGIRFERLAGAVAKTPPSDQMFVTLTRVTLTPGADTISRSRQQDGPDLAYMDVGTLGVTAPGIQGTHSPGTMVFIEPGVEAAAHNAGFGPVVLLTLSISAEPGDTGVATPEAATPAS